MTDISVWMQLVRLAVLAIPVACVSWTVTHEEIFREPREYCIKRSKTSKKLLHRKFFYVFTCEYCFSHYIALIALLFTGFQLLINDWRGYVIAGFSLVWIANVYMSLFALIRTDIKVEKLESSLKEKELNGR